MNEFLTTLYHSLFAAQQEVAKLRAERELPMQSVGSSNTVIDLLRDDGHYTGQHEMLYKVDAQVSDIIREGNAWQSKWHDQRLAAAKEHEKYCRQMIALYMSTHYVFRLQEEDVV